MKKILSAFSGLIIALFLNAQAPDWGIADTLEHHSLGPGIQYTKIRYKDKPLLIWVTTIDLNNPNNKIEQVQSHNKVPDIARETVMDMSKNNTYKNHKVCVAFNHDFFVYEAGVCIGLNISNGEIPYSNGWGRSLFAISEDKTASVFAPNLDAKINLPDGSSVKIDFFNSNALGLTGECILFNRFNSLMLTESGKYIKIKPQSKWTVNGADVECEVVEISNSPLQTNQNDYIIYARGSKLTAFDGKIQVGDKITISQKFINGKFGTPAKNIVNAFHGYPSIAYEGKLHDGEYNDFENGREYEVSSRVMAGMSQDGKTVYIVTVEAGSSNSIGVNCIEIANWMLAHGSWNVVNFDSGGSVAIVVDHEMLNVPARGSIRPVQDALLVISTAEESNEIASYSFIIPTLTTPQIALNSLTLFSFNTNGEVLQKNVEGFTYTCIPKDLGVIDENNVFHAGKKCQQGKILATKDGITAELSVNVCPLSNIKISSTDFLVDNTHNYPIKIEGTLNNKQYCLDASAFEWISSNPEYCIIENGILKGLKNGTAIVVGTFGDFKDSLRVTVQIPTSGRMIGDNFDVENWTLNASAPLNAVLNTENLPSNWTHGAAVNYVYTSTRAPFIKLLRNAPMYGLPDTLKLIVNVGDINITKALLSLRANNATVSASKEFTTIPKNTDTELSVAMSELFDATDIAIYPVWFDNINFYLGTQTSGQAYTLALKEIVLCYQGVEISGIPSVLLSQYEVYPNPLDGTILNIRTKNNDANLLQAQLFHLNGQCVVSQQLNPVNGMATFKVGKLPAGNYLLKIYSDDNPETIKLIVK
ncbi:MAG TPA: phosphodiester glycosidase family protein [Paludibacteraceae bacterium]|nr:phosphodiester glycosidase family protein [Paludibacteraceae bacterium]